MSNLLASAATIAIGCYVAAMAIAAWRLMRGPSAQDRILALDFISVNGVLVVLVLGIRHASPMYFEAALLLALFGFLASTAMAKFVLRGEVIE
jgi:multicomponent K+:H+ antiporter subunit F